MLLSMHTNTNVPCVALQYTVTTTFTVHQATGRWGCPKFDCQYQPRLQPLQRKSLCTECGVASRSSMPNGQHARHLPGLTLLAQALQPHPAVSGSIQRGLKSVPLRPA